MNKRILYFIGIILPFSIAIASNSEPLENLNLDTVVSYFDFVTPPPNKVIINDYLRLQLRLHIESLGVKVAAYQWVLPKEVTLLPVNKNCLDSLFELNLFPQRYPTQRICDFDVIIKSTALNYTIEGMIDFVTYKISNPFAGLSFEKKFSTPPLSIRVVPHSLSLAAIPQQFATANSNFYFDLKPYVLYLDENLQSGKIVSGSMIPTAQDGLVFDATNWILSGKPNRTGSYTFITRVEGTHSRTESVNLNVYVQANQQDKPVFKTNAMLFSATLGRSYRMNLVDLIDSGYSYLLHNQLSFRIDKNQPYPDWLEIDTNNKIFLKGEIPASIDGGTYQVTLIATSNTGGDSLAKTLTIPVATDPLLKPTLDYFEINKKAGQHFSVNLSPYVDNPSQDQEFRLLLDQVIPQAPWIETSSTNSKVLQGVIPSTAVGQQFLLKLRVSTRLGGSSEPKQIPLNIIVDQELVPRFKSGSPQLPLIIPGEAFYYDFVANRDIYPDFEDIPYQVDFAKECNNPPWMTLKKNRLVAESIPDSIEGVQPLCLRIKNVPGGESELIKLNLLVMDSTRRSKKKFSGY